MALQHFLVDLRNRYVVSMSWNMKQKNVKVAKLTNSLKSSVQVDTHEGYLQINKLSFQQNFKFLIGHYKQSTTKVH